MCNVAERKLGLPLTCMMRFTNSQLITKLASIHLITLWGQSAKKWGAVAQQPTEKDHYNLKLSWFGMIVNTRKTRRFLETIKLWDGTVNLALTVMTNWTWKRTTIQLSRNLIRRQNSTLDKGIKEQKLQVLLAVATLNTRRSSQKNLLSQKTLFRRLQSSFQPNTNLWRTRATRITISMRQDCKMRQQIQRIAWFNLWTIGQPGQPLSKNRSPKR